MLTPDDLDAIGRRADRAYAWLVEHVLELPADVRLHFNRDVPALITACRPHRRPPRPDPGA